MDIENRLAECLSRLPIGVTVEYEIIQGAVYWRISEKPVGLTLEQEQKILSDLNSIAYENSMLTGKKHVIVTQHPVTQNHDEFKTLCGKLEPNMGNQEYVNCRNHVNCGGYAEPKSEYCEECLEEQAEIEAEQAEQRAAIVDLKNALAFLDQVRSATDAERQAVRSDHLALLEQAARKVASVY